MLFAHHQTMLPSSALFSKASSRGSAQQSAPGLMGLSANFILHGPNVLSVAQQKDSAADAARKQVQDLLAQARQMLEQARNSKNEQLQFAQQAEQMLSAALKLLFQSSKNAADEILQLLREYQAELYYHRAEAQMLLNKYHMAFMDAHRAMMATKRLNAEFGQAASATAQMQMHVPAILRIAEACQKMDNFVMAYDYVSRVMDAAARGEVNLDDEVLRNNQACALLYQPDALLQLQAKSQEQDAQFEQEIAKLSQQYSGDRFDIVNAEQEQSRSALQNVVLAQVAAKRQSLRVDPSSIKSWQRTSFSASEEKEVNSMLEKLVSRACGSKVAVQEIAGMGRGVVATTRIAKDDVIARDLPVIFVSMDKPELHCDNCGQPFAAAAQRFDSTTAEEAVNQPDKKQTNVAYYCSKSCRELAWKKWQDTMSTWSDYQSFRAKIFDRATTTSSLLWLHAIKLSAMRTQKSWQRFCSLLARNFARGSDSKESSAGKIVLLHEIAQYIEICDTMPHMARDPEFDFDLFLDSVAMCVPNVFSGAGTTRNKHGTQTGSFLFGFNTMMNHSCVPNCHEMYHEGGMLIIAARDIEPGEQLFIDYLPRRGIDMSLSSRQAILRSQYGFECRCDLCLKQQSENHQMR